MAQATLAAVARGSRRPWSPRRSAVRGHTRSVAYNRFSHNVDRLAVRFESFMEEFSNILQRQARRARERARNSADLRRCAPGVS